jgi:hypothetical protein
LAGYTDGPIGIALGMPTLRQVSDEKFYTGLPGGLLDSAGRLFQRSVTVYVYPTRNPVTGRIESVENAIMPPPWHHLHDLLLEIRRIVPIHDYDLSLLNIRTTEVLARLQNGDSTWETMVPAVVAQTIKAENLFGLRPELTLQSA